ncbi:MAG: glycosyltransferase family 2 protein [Candidatus Omnitrophota bacterium]
MKVSVIIPAHNEAAGIAVTIRRLEEALKLDYEIVVINDHSTDMTTQVVRGLFRDFSNIRMVDNTDQPGFANALRAGFKAATGEFIVPVMADLCDEAATITKMYEKINEGFDIVCGSRYMRGGGKIGGPKLKSFFSRFVGISLYFLIGVPTHDIANSFKMYKKTVLNSIIDNSKADGFALSVELSLLAYFAGYKISEVPTIWIDRKGGESKFSVLKQAKGYLRLYLWALGENLIRCLLKKKK